MLGDRTTLHIYVALVSSPCAVAIPMWRTVASVCEVLLVCQVRARLGTSVPLHRRVPSMRWHDLRTTVCTRFDFYPLTRALATPAILGDAMCAQLRAARWMGTQW